MSIGYEMAIKDIQSAAIPAQTTAPADVPTAGAVPQDTLQERMERAMGPRRDYLHPKFEDHNCWRCNNGKNPCVHGSYTDCHLPRARND